MRMYLAFDPVQDRVAAQSWAFAERDFPPGPEGKGWSLRTVEIDDETWAGVLSGAPLPDDQDQLHRQWWDTAEEVTP